MEFHQSSYELPINQRFSSTLQLSTYHRRIIEVALTIIHYRSVIGVHGEYWRFNMEGIHGIHIESHSENLQGKNLIFTKCFINIAKNPLKCHFTIKATQYWDPINHESIVFPLYATFEVLLIEAIIFFAAVLPVLFSRLYNLWMWAVFFIWFFIIR